MRTVWKRLQKKGEGLDGPGNVFRLHVAQAELVGAFGAQLWGKSAGAQLRINRRSISVILLFVERLRFQQLRLIRALGGWIGSQELVHFGQKR